MINEHQRTLNPDKLREDMTGMSGILDSEIISDITTLFQLYHSGMNEFGTKLENLDSEFQTRFNYNPIHHMEARMKDVSSLFKKMQTSERALASIMCFFVA